MKENEADRSKTIVPNTILFPNPYTGKTKIHIRRSFGQHDLVDLYTDYLADKVISRGKVLVEKR